MLPSCSACGSMVALGRPTCRHCGAAIATATGTATTPATTTWGAPSTAPDAGEKERKLTRPAGAVLMLVGAIPTYVALVRPMQQIADGEPDVLWFPKIGGLGVMLMAYGLLATIFGGALQGFVKHAEADPGKLRLTPQVVLLMLFTGGLGVAAMIYFDVYATAHGYGR